MSVLTEASIRLWLKNRDTSKPLIYEINKGDIITPSAKSYLMEKKIKLSTEIHNDLVEKEIIEDVKSAKSVLPPVSYPERYESIYGGFFSEKPEFMTQLYGSKLVFKDHKNIAFRGKIDSFEAKILETQIRLLNIDLKPIVDDLQEILNFVKNILRCEVLSEELQEIRLLGMDDTELRRISHNPKKYFDINHFAPSYEQGEAMVLLNSLRVYARETELVAYNTFKNEYGIPERNDIIKALNRLSSLFYIMMCKYLSREYR